MESNDLVLEVRNKTDIVEVISELLPTPLEKKGKNYFCVCPFHNDTNPSMSISKDKQIYRCFSCGESGNVFNFVEKYKSYSFAESLNYLANRIGIKTNYNSNIKVNSVYQKYYDIYDLAVKYYINNINTKNAVKAKEYLYSRGINNDVINKFKIGLSSSDNKSLTKFLLSKNYDIDTLNKIGLSNSDNDVYSDRIMFPLCDTSGNVVGFSARIYFDKDTSKYMNTKETPIFKKGEMLYNYHIAKESHQKDIIVMEGFMDIIRASTIGIDNAVALMGTAMTDTQANLITRISNNIILCFDGDNAGIKATLSNGEYFKSKNIDVKVVVLENGMDPDTYIINNGKDKFLNLIENAISFYDFKLSSIKKDYNTNLVEDKTKYVNVVIREISVIKDDIQREIMLKNLAIETDISYNTLEKRLQEILKINKSNNSKNEKVVVENKNRTIKKDKFLLSNYAIIYYMLVNNNTIKIIDRERLVMSFEKINLLKDEIINYYDRYGSVSIADFYTYLSNKIELLDIYNEVLKEEFPDILVENTILDYVKVIREDGKNREIRRLKEKINELSDPFEKAKIAEEIRSLLIGS